MYTYTRVCGIERHIYLYIYISKRYNFKVIHKYTTVSGMRRYKSRWYRMFLFSSSSSWSSSTNDTMCVWWQMYVLNMPTQTQLGKPAVCLQCTYLCVCMYVWYIFHRNTVFVYNFPCIDFWMDIFFFFSGLITANINVIEWSIQKNINAVSVAVCVCMCIVYVLLYTKMLTQVKLEENCVSVFFNNTTKKKINIVIGILGDSRHCWISQHTFESYIYMNHMNEYFEKHSD